MLLLSHTLRSLMLEELTPLVSYLYHCFQLIGQLHLLAGDTEFLKPLLQMILHHHAYCPNPTVSFLSYRNEHT